MKKFFLLLPGVFAVAVFAAEEPVPASKFGFQADDATACLEKAFASGEKKIRIDRQQSDWIIRPVSLPGDVELIIDPGVTVRAKKGEFKPKGAALFAIRNVKNVTLRGGKGSRLLMNKSDYQDKKQYQSSEWRHAVSICGSDNVIVRDLIVEASGGDGIYISTGKTQRYSSNVLLENLDSVSNHRQGLSVISCEHLRVRNCRFRDTSGTAPAAGIDFEPNASDERLADCVVENCTLSGNRGCGLLFYLFPLTAESKPVSIVIRNCDISDNRGRAIEVDCCRGASQVKGSILIENCRVLNAPGSALRLRNQRSDGFSLCIKDCSVDNAESSYPALRIFCQTTDSRIANFTLDNLKISDKKHKEFCSLESAGAKPEFAGSVFFNGEKTDLAAWSKVQKVSDFAAFTPAKLDMDKLAVPAGPGKTAAGIRVCGAFSFHQYAKQGQLVEIAATNVPVGRRHNSYPVEIFAPDGKLLKTQTVEPGKNPLSFTAPVSGIYRISGKSTKGMGLVLDSALPGCGFDAAKLRMVNSAKRKLYFEVPAGAKEVMLRLQGEEREFITMRIFNQKNELVGELKDVTVGKVFRHTRVFAEKAEVWHVEFTRMVEHAVLELGGDLNPIVSASPSLLFRTNK